MRRSERQKMRAARAERRAATPIAGAIAGILFAVLFSLSVAIIETSMADLPHDTGSWPDTGAGRFKFAIALMPFAGCSSCGSSPWRESDWAGSKTSSSPPSSWGAVCCSWQ